MLLPWWVEARAAPGLLGQVGVTCLQCSSSIPGPRPAPASERRPSRARFCGRCWQRLSAALHGQFQHESQQAHPDARGQDDDLNNAGHGGHEVQPEVVGQVVAGHCTAICRWVPKRSAGGCDQWVGGSPRSSGSGPPSGRLQSGLRGAPPEDARMPHAANRCRPAGHTAPCCAQRAAAQQVS